MGMVDESQAGSELYCSGIQYEKPVSCIVAGRGRSTLGGCEVGVLAGHMPMPCSVFMDISLGFMVTDGCDRGG